MSELIAGRDYVIEDGYTVFTVHFLSARGHCCGNGCRNCPYSFPNDKRVVSLVPSWTDTLLRCGVTVIGRTRYCIHPSELVREIVQVGGTKQCDDALVNSLEPDLILLDEEENAKAFLESLDAPIIATHVRDIASMIAGMIAINRAVKNQELNRLIKEGSALRPLAPGSLAIDRLPGVLRWIRKPSGEIRTLVYLIWKDPWMAVSRHTFVGAVLDFLGYGGLLPDFDQDYPIVSLDDFDRETTLFLFASEPFPFGRKETSIQALGLNAAIVDGECYSWFGIKSIEFLKNALAGPRVRAGPAIAEARAT